MKDVEERVLMKKTVSKKTLIILCIVGVLILIPCAIFGFQMGRELIYNIRH